MPNVAVFAGANMPPLSPTDAGNLAAAVATLTSLLSSVSSQAIATGTPGNPATQTMSVQGNNEQLLLGAFSLSAAGTFFTQALATNSTPFTTLSVNVLAVGTGGSVVFYGCNEPPTGTQYWSKIDVNNANNQQEQSSIGGTGLVYIHVPYAYIKVVLAGSSITGTYTISAHLTKGSPPTRSVVAQGDPVGYATSGNPLGMGLQVATSLPAASTNGYAIAAISTAEGVAISKPFSIPQADWTYAAASGGIASSMTPVALVAATTGKRNYLTGLSIDHDALSAASEITVIDGASTVIWRGRLGTGAQYGMEYKFPTPLRSSAGNALNVAMVSAVTGAVYVNAQGYVAY